MLIKTLTLHSLTYLVGISSSLAVTKSFPRRVLRQVSSRIPVLKLQ
jgi:hypothetical protein